MVIPQLGRQGSWPLWGLLEALEQGKQGEHFFHLWLRVSGGEVFGQRAEASDSPRVDSLDPKGGLSRFPPLWSVLGGQAGGEEELRTEHLPSLGPAGGPGQVRPYVGPLSAFCSDSGLVLSFTAGPKRGKSRPCQGKSVHYKGTPMGPPTAQLGRPHRVHP